jgi:Siphovirus ReqiPepy6 Gp37-like protein
MQPHTLDRSFHKQDEIDGFNSVIWTERYYGDSEVELVVPATSEMIKKLPEGTFLGLPESDEVMILETALIEEGKLKLTGMSLLPWLNNRFVRTSAKHEDQTWALSGGPPGWTVWAILWNMCHRDSPYLQVGSVAMGIPNPERFIIPGLNLRDYDKSGDNISVGVPFGPVYDAMREIATTYRIGMQITLDSVTDTSYSLGFRSYKGLDRTSAQNVNSVIRFSPQMDSLTDIKELRSIAALKTVVYAFASSLDTALKPLATTPGISSMTGPQYTGFDLRALQIFAGDIKSDSSNTIDAAKLLNILNSRAYDARTQNRVIKTVDGEIVPTNQFKYGVHYNLGDVIEVQGLSEIVQTSRVVEYIRAQDEAGERAYPTVAMLD